MKKVAFYTLGCKLNFSETSTLARLFEQKGFKRVEFTDCADIYIINTCSVTDHADRKCKKVVREAKKFSPNSFVAIVGCYAQLKPDEIAQIEGVDAVLGASEKFRLLDLLEGFVKTEKPKVFAQPVSQAKDFVPGYSLNDRTRSFLKLQDGCNYNCSFCTIPLARGKSRSTTPQVAAEQAALLAESGVKEIVLTGVNLGDFGIVDGVRKHTFLELLKALDKVNTVKRYRISSVEPNLLHPEVIEFCAASERFMPHFHMPLQSGSDKILRKMYRRYNRELYAKRVEMILKLMPDACVGVDVITGFPGEGSAEFLETYQFLNELPISYLHVFTYSERDNTPAATLPEKVLSSWRQERTTQLISLSEKKKRAFYESQLKSTRPVLWEADVVKGFMTGFTDNYVRVKDHYDPLQTNEISLSYLDALDSDGLVLATQAYEPQLAH
jgi:threonylcarbamoyladenosine tRNA methylthiotransferase MtaB